MATIINTAQVFGTLLISLFLIDKYGRKTILQGGSVMSAVSNLLSAVGFFILGSNEDSDAGKGLVLTGLILYMVTFGASLGPIVWMYIPEVVDPKIVPFATAVNWFSGSLVIILFPIIT